MTQRMRRWLFLSTLALAGIFLFGFSVTSGQAVGGSLGAALAGTVLDGQKQPVQGATVTIQSPGGSGQEFAHGEESGQQERN